VYVHTIRRVQCVYNVYYIMCEITEYFYDFIFFLNTRQWLNRYLNTWYEHTVRTIFLYIHMYINITVSTFFIISLYHVSVICFGWFDNIWRVSLWRKQKFNGTDRWGEKLNFACKDVSYTRSLSFLYSSFINLSANLSFIIL
jgi:hypothetical protein